MGEGGCLLVILLLLPAFTPNILLQHTPNNLENLLDVEVETEYDSDLIEQDGFEIFGEFGYSNSLADLDFPVVYKDIVNMEVVDVIDDNLKASVNIRDILFEQNLVAVKSEQLATEILEKVENEIAGIETENFEESGKIKEQVGEFIKDAEGNTEEESHLEEVPSETEIKDTEANYDEFTDEELNNEFAAVEENIESVQEMTKTGKSAENESTEIISESEQVEEENHLDEVPSETEIKDTEANYDEVTDEELNDEKLNDESAAVEENIESVQEMTKTDKSTENVSTEIMSRIEQVDKKSDIIFVDEKPRQDEVARIDAGNYKEEDFTNVSPKVIVIASSNDYEIEEEAIKMELNENLNIMKEEDETKTLQEFSCANVFKQQLIILAIFIQCIVMRI
eukprot:GFUD01123330.1.p1 GENE.GFUD01123330.1~~GFUD01123330.1.p1  ORF type:complete len:396 (+),score=148.20 GFUD01123330.1:34-1221(+)